MVGLENAISFKVEFEIPSNYTYGFFSVYRQSHHQVLSIRVSNDSNFEYYLSQLNQDKKSLC
jgi:hypothetical protein